jgi:hypothetical protein
MGPFSLKHLHNNKKGATTMIETEKTRKEFERSRAKARADLTKSLDNAFGKAKPSKPAQRKVCRRCGARYEQQHTCEDRKEQ